MTRGNLRKLEQLERRELLAADVEVGDELSSSAGVETETVQASGLESTSRSAGIDESPQSSDRQLALQTDVVLDWNDLFGDLLVANEVNQNPGYASRSMAMLNLAIYDAVAIAASNPDDAFYDYAITPDSAANVNAAIAASQAAYTVLSSLYADQQAMIDSFLERSLAGYDGSVDIEPSVTLGSEVGNQILAARAGDGSAALVDYAFTEGVGYFQADPLNPDVPVWGVGWGEVATFAISSAERFAPETTPALTSEEYAASYNEVLELGSVDSILRTADQTEAGIFWAYDRVGLGTPLALFNDVLETIAVQQGNTLEENAALFAQASVAMADAAIVAWHVKFDEQFWRPITAIHDGDIDGNELTAGDEDWIPLGAPDGGEDVVGFTPQFPTYISGHATFGGALFGTLQQFYGADDISFELSSQELEILLEDPALQEAYGLDLDDAVRSFDSFSEAMAENGRSRVYLGIHFDFDDLLGQEVGQHVAASVASEFVVATSDGDGGNGSRRPIRRGGQPGVEGPRREREPRIRFEGSVLSMDMGDRRVTADVIVAIDDSRVELVDARSGEVLDRRAVKDVSQIQLVGPERVAERLMIDLSAAEAVIPGGIFVDGGEDGESVVDLFGADEANTVEVDGDQVTVNGTTINFTNVDLIRWHAGGGEENLTTLGEGDAQFVVLDGERDTSRQLKDGPRAVEAPIRNGPQLASPGQQTPRSQ
ncbi:MAG: hypothetical protein AAF961_04665, partial [Planctomycetota bacterium]